KATTGMEKLIKRLKREKLFELDALLLHQLDDGKGRNKLTHRELAFRHDRPLKPSTARTSGSSHARSRRASPPTPSPQQARADLASGVESCVRTVRKTGARSAARESRSYPPRRGPTRSSEP